MVPARINSVLFLILVAILITSATSSQFIIPDKLASSIQKFETFAHHVLGSKDGSIRMSSLLRQDEEDSPFSPASVNPEGPASSIPSTNTLLMELASWSQLALFNLLLSSTDILPGTGPYVVLAPIQFAFLELLQRISPKEDFFMETPEVIYERFKNESFGFDLLKDILSYHIVPGNFTEKELVGLGTVPTLQGADIDFTEFSTLNDNDVTFPSERSKRRFYRSVETRTGRLLMIDAVLLPFNLSEALEEFGLEEFPYPSFGTRLPVVGSLDSSLMTPPWLSLQTFIFSRADTQILQALFLIYGKQVQSAMRGFTERVHFFAPTDRAFFSLALQLVGDKVDIDEGDPVAEILNVAAGILDVIRGISGIPTLPEILLYHIVRNDASFESLIGEGSLPTFYPNATLSVTEDGVEDNDPTRGPAKRIATFPTFQGWVTVIDSVLLPFDLGIAQAVINANINEAAPSPQACPEEDRACFAGEATVRHSDGRRVRMTDLQAGDEVHVDTIGTSSKIFLFTHRSPSLGRFMELETENGRSICLTKEHYLYANGRMVVAGSVQVGDLLETENGSERVVKVGSVVRRGIFAPHSVHGGLMVDGVRVSSYTKTLSPRLAHAILAPVRGVVTWCGFKEPLGSVFYNGLAERWTRPVAWLLGGADRY